MSFRRKNAAVQMMYRLVHHVLRPAPGILLSAALGASTVLSVPAPSAAAPVCPTSLNVVAHQDDDLLFINPDISGDLAAGRCVVTLFTTAGDAGKGVRYWRGREAGSMAAYAAMAGVPNRWTVDSLMAGDRPLTRMSLVGAPVSLVFLRLPDGHGYAVSNFETLHKLWTGAIPTIHAIDGSASYTKESLTETMTAVMDTTRPSVIRTLNYAGPLHDGDHGDHHTAGYLTLAAHKGYRAPHRIYAYMGYQISRRPANLTTAARDAKLGAFLAYAPFDSHVCRTRKACLNHHYTPWFSRRYSVGSEVGGGRNVALEAAVSASSDSPAAQHAGKAVDDAVAGAPVRPHQEWATRGGRAGSWISLSWSTPQLLKEVVLYDRPNSKDQVTAGTLHFSDGSTVKVGVLPDNGSARVVTFAPRSVTGLSFRVDEVSRTTVNVGLAELQAYAAVAAGGGAPS